MDTTHTPTGLEKFTLPDHARVWIFQADRFLTDEETAKLEEAGERFAAQWRAHGKELSAEFGTVDNLFVVMAIDEKMEGASGCSIDTFMLFIQDAEREIGLSLTNRLCFAGVVDGETKVIRSAEAKTYVDAGSLTGDTPVFDTLVSSLGELRNGWLKPASALWVKRLLG